MFGRLKRALEIALSEGWVSLAKKIQWRIRRNWFWSEQAVLKVRQVGTRPGSLATLTSELPLVDVIIVTYNSACSIETCIQSIFASEYPKKKVHLTVVDNDSTDDTRWRVERLKAGLPNLRILESSNVGYGAAVNLGSRDTRGRYLLILNPDTELKADTLSRLVSVALDTEAEGFCAWEARQQPLEHPKLYDPVTLETEWVSGACFLVSRQAFLGVSGFDENIFLYGEDVDLSWRLRAQGFRLRYVPAAVVVHAPYRDRSRSDIGQFKNSLLSNGCLRLKHGTIREIVVYCFGVLAVFARAPRIKGIRWTLLLAFLAATPSLLRTVKVRLVKGRLTPPDIPRFNGWDYEIRRKGAFYKIKSPTEAPVISIIVRTVQRPHFLREALHSIRNQTYRPLQVIVIEDGRSTSAEVVEEFSDLDVKYRFTGIPVGRSRAGNLGLSLAAGRYINFLDDDDLLFADHVEVLVGELDTDRSRLAAYSIGLEVQTHVMLVDPFIYEERSYRVVYEEVFNRELLGRANYIPINCMMFSRSLFLNEGGFDETREFLEDWDLWLRYSQVTDFIFVEKVTCLYRVPADKKAAEARQRNLDLTLRRQLLKD